MLIKNNLGQKYAVSRKRRKTKPSRSTGDRYNNHVRLWHHFEVRTWKNSSQVEFKVGSKCIKNQTIPDQIPPIKLSKTLVSLHRFDKWSQITCSSRDVPLNISKLINHWLANHVLSLLTCPSWHVTLDISLLIFQSFYTMVDI